MKRRILLFLAVFCMIAGVAAAADYDFEDPAQSLSLVTNTLGQTTCDAVFTEDGFQGAALVLDGTYGLSLGTHGSQFTVSAMVRLSSNGTTDTLFFREMGTGSAEAWTGVINKSGVPAIWTHDGGTYRWSTVTRATDSISGRWAHVVYTQNGAVCALYVDGALIGSGNSATATTAPLYLGVTRWAADAMRGAIDNLKIEDRVWSADEVKTVYTDYALSALSLPEEAIADLALPTVVGTASITWTSDNQSVISSGGKVQRGETDQRVTLTATLPGGNTRTFEVVVLGLAAAGNDEVIVSYTFGNNDGAIIHDRSGNGNHATAYNNLAIGEDGAEFDGNDDYVEMPTGLLYGHDTISIAMELNPQIAKTHQFTFNFGNSSSAGYLFLNTSRPTTNTLRAAITRSGSSGEQDVASVPGLLIGEWSSVVLVLDGTKASLYQNGELVAESTWNMTVSDLGRTTQNWLAKSPYGDAYFKGTMREFTIYNKAMSAEEIAEKYGTTPPVTGDTVQDVQFSADRLIAGETLTANVSLLRGAEAAWLLYDADGNLLDTAVSTLADGAASITLPADVTGCMAELVIYDAERTVLESYVVGSGALILRKTQDEGDTVVVTVSNTTAEAMDGMLIAAVYKDEILTRLTAEALSVAPHGSAEAILTQPLQAGETARIFYWDALGSMIPLASAI